MSQSSSPFTVDPQTLLHLKAALIDFRLRSAACPECGGDAEGKPHAENCSFGYARHLVDHMLSDDYQLVFTRARLRQVARRATGGDRTKSAGPSYLKVDSRFGPLWVHRCAPLPDHEDGPDWARRERLLVDAGASGSYIDVNGARIPFHAHLFRETDGQFYLSERDRRRLPSEVPDELEALINSRPLA